MSFKEEDGIDYAAVTVQLPGEDGPVYIWHENSKYVYLVLIRGGGGGGGDGRIRSSISANVTVFPFSLSHIGASLSFLDAGRVIIRGASDWFYSFPF